MKKYLLTIIMAAIIGFFLGNFLLKQYKDYKSLTVSSNGEEVYFFEYGIYNSLIDMENSTINLENYIYKIENNKYYVYIGITKDKDNIEKLKQHFKSLNYSVELKTYYIKNEEFINVLNNLDLVIKNTNDSTTISSIICQILQKYEEIINNGNKN